MSYLWTHIPGSYLMDRIFIYSYRNAPKASGGVELLIKSWMFEAYYITVVDKSFEGILAVKFVNKETDRDFVALSCYLPPENSTRGRDAS